ncbi:MAG: 5'-nucleotidase C-terminal domain-containing protein [Planctomycetota bacterium]|jgi:5'-nucleotidase|nr:5'-nucleotidase C-terminal domain-containing protein [Planctomycetota bacterium]
MMTERLRASFWTFLLVLTLVGGGWSAADELTVIATNDLHGHLTPRIPSRASQPPIGGVGWMGGYFDAVRQENPGRVLLLDAGDLFSGTIIADYREGKAVIDCMNALGYGASAVGNHEFDFGPIGPKNTLGPGVDPRGTFKARLAQSRFPFLAANIRSRKTGTWVEWPNCKRYHLFDMKGIKVGVIGLATPETPKVTFPPYVDGIEFTSMLEAARELIPVVRKEGAQVVILLAHAGAIRNGSARWGFSGEVVDLAAALPPGSVDLIVSGHTHRLYRFEVNGIQIVQGSCCGAGFQRLDIYVDSKTKRTDASKNRYHPFQPFLGSRSPEEAVFYRGKRIQRSEALLKILDPYRKEAEKVSSRVLGNAKRDLRTNRGAESELANYVADSVYRSFDGVSAVFLNSGGLRARIQKGPITVGSVYRAIPFNNKVVLLTLTGVQVRALLEQGVQGRRGILLVSGIRYTYKPKSPIGERVGEILYADGKPVLPTDQVRCATLDFLYRGGDGYTLLAEGTQVEPTEHLLRDIVTQSILKETEPIVGKIDGRMRKVVD